MTSDLLSILSTKSDIPTVTVAGSMRKAPLQLRSGLNVSMHGVAAMGAGQIASVG